MKKDICLYFFKILFIYSRETKREGQKHRQREEKQTPCREPKVGLDPRTPGSRPELKADAQPLSHPSIPGHMSLNATIFPNLFLMQKRKKCCSPLNWIKNFNCPAQCSATCGHVMIITVVCSFSKFGGNIRLCWPSRITALWSKDYSPGMKQDYP